MISLSDSQEYQAFIERTVTTGIIFYADWDGNSKILLGLLEHKHNEESLIEFAKANVDCPELYAEIVQLGITTTPAIILYRHGAVLRKLHGQQNLTWLRFETETARDKPESAIDATISLFHSPFNWQEVLNRTPCYPLNATAGNPIQSKLCTPIDVGPARGGHSVYDRYIGKWLRPANELFRLETHTYVLTGDRKVGGDYEGGPFIYLYIWASSDEAACWTVTHNFDVDKIEYATPPNALLLHPGHYTYGEIMTDAATNSIDPCTTSYIYDTRGWCRGYYITAGKTTYNFRSNKKRADEQVYTIIFDNRK